MNIQAWAGTSVPTEKKFVRVAVLDNVDELTVSIRGKYQITESASGAVLKTGRTLEEFRISSREGGVQLDEQLYPLKRISLTPAKEVAFHLPGKVQRYRGTISIIQKPNQKFLVVNVIEMEQYIKGVLYHEVSHRWPMEAMKAQAVAARTYALYQMRRNKNADYDVTGDIYSQVYGGKSAERFRTNIAVNRTEGQVLVYKNKILPAYFHASCGGHTENARNIWGHDLPPLYGVQCPFCRLEPNFNWVRNFRSQDVRDKLNARGYKIGAIQDIRVLERNESGRIKTLMVTDRPGNFIRIPGIKFREILGPNVVRSNKYEVVMKGYYFDLVGNGWGHGVGLCQWGAHRMAEERHKYDEILSFYYPGAELVNSRDINADDGL
ncbi:MAG: SpoIID/LytB domain-containing protein [Candidatus Omnitrophica bacterium]|nr:SpoIID/LytB domain-containing protein [Candidatus Omnitrophota bacterium]